MSNRTYGGLDDPWREKRALFSSIIQIFSILLCLLLTFACQDQSDLGRTAFPSHISFMVDDETFAELRDSDFLLNEFAGASVKTLTVDSGLSWTGVYVYGRNTYLEFSPEEEDFPAGSCSIALEVAEAGELKRIKSRLEKLWEGPLGEIGLRTKVSAGDESPWFHYLDLYEYVGSDSLSPWLLEWDPDAIADHYGKPLKRLVDDDGQRHDDPSFVADRILDNIVEITAPLEGSELDDWSRFLIALGFQRTDQGDVVRFSSDDLAFNFRIGSQALALELKMTLLRDPRDREEISFGKWLRLKFNGDKTASLSFMQKSE